MKSRVLIILLLSLILAGCETITPEAPKDFTYSYEMNSIEKQDQDEIQSWLHEPDQTATRTYEIYDETNGRYLVYAHSSKFSEIEVTQKGDAVFMMFTDEKADGSGQDAFVKIKFNPDIIKNFVLDSEETE
jgi:ABC-type uncharacterized transport system auxiliary subunit